VKIDLLESPVSAENKAEAAAIVIATGKIVTVEAEIMVVEITAAEAAADRRGATDK
jgi:hypothetical protein